jgi:hypothetical protein
MNAGMPDENPAMHVYLDRLMKKQAKLVRDLNKIEQSYTWKFLAPWRYVVSLFRERRVKKHLKKRGVT